jgi:SanA protein
MVNKMIKRIVRMLWLFLLVVVVLLAGGRAYTALKAESALRTAADAPACPVAIVFGAGLWRDGSPTPILRDRVATAAELYFAGKVQWLLMSGAPPEPAVMQSLAVSLGVPEQAIRLDDTGLRTYDTCYRARQVYQLEAALLVTQKFHLPRALYLCQAFGMQVEGVAADRQAYRRTSQAIWQVRESLATLLALWEVHVSPPALAVEPPQPIVSQSWKENCNQE